MCCQQAEVVDSKKATVSLTSKLTTERSRNAELNRRVIAANEALGKSKVSDWDSLEGG